MNIPIRKARTTMENKETSIDYNIDFDELADEYIRE